MKRDEKSIHSLLLIGDLVVSRFFADNCEIVADDESLMRRVGWCYYLTKEKFRSFEVHGQDFIFVSSDVFGNEREDRMQLQRLISANAAGLCLVNDFQYYSLSRPTLELARENHFPIIVMNGTLRYEKIVRRINEMILNHRGTEAEKNESENYYRLLLKMETDDIGQLIRFTADYLGRDVAYWHLYSEPMATSPLNVRSVLTPETLDKIDSNGEEEPFLWKNYAAMTIHVLKERYAYVLFYGDNPITGFELIILRKLTSFLRDRVVNAFIRRLQIQHGSQSSWVHDWLEGRSNERTVEAHLEQAGLLEDGRKIYGFLAVCIRMPEAKGTHSYSYRKSYDEDFRISNDEFLSSTVRLWRAFFSYHFRSFHHIEGNLLEHLFVATEPVEDPDRVFTEIGDTLCDNPYFLENIPIRVGAGSLVPRLGDVPDSFKEALFCCDMHCCPERKIIFYDQLHIYSYIEHLYREGWLDIFCERELGVLRKEKNSVLLNTLRTYLASNGEKKETAEKLKITRKTLYARLERIEEILGEDFLTGSRRASLEAALLALPYCK